jgi:hypothetical protein
LNKRPHKKPIGEDGPIRVSAPQGKAEIEWRKFEHPPEKHEQETVIATAFVNALNQTEKPPFGLSRLEEDDFDFELQSDDAKRYLELQENLLPGKKRGPPYTAGEQVIDEQKFAKTMLSAIQSKAWKYPRGLRQPLDLLMYHTHWRFRPNDAVLKLVAHGLKDQNLPFARVYYFQRLGTEEGGDIVTKLFPDASILNGFRLGDPTSKYANFDPAAARLFNEGGKVGVKFNLSADAVKKLGLAQK